MDRGTLNIADTPDLSAFGKEGITHPMADTPVDGSPGR